MKKYFWMIFIIALLGTGPGYGKDATDFRNVKWGMSRDEVIQLEKLRLKDEEPSKLFYETAIAGQQCILIYSFINDKLFSGNYLFSDKHSNYNEYINDYLNIKALLEEKYGKYTDNDQKWTQKINFELDKGMAVAMGYLNYLSSWKTDATEIDLLLFGDNLDVKLGISYRSIKYLKEAREQEKNEELENL